MTHFRNIKKIISESSLSLSDQIGLIALYARANDSDLADTFKLFTEDPAWIHKLSENYKAKQAALITGDQVLWEEIVKEEEAQLKELES